MNAAAIVKNTARAAGFKVNARAGTGSCRGTVLVQFVGERPDARVMAGLSDWLRREFPAVEFLGGDVMPVEFCRFWTAP